MRISQIPSLPYSCIIYRFKIPLCGFWIMCLMRETEKLPSANSHSEDSSAFIRPLVLGFTALSYVQFIFTIFFFQVLPHDELMETKRSHRQSHRKKVLPEIYLTRLLSTKVSRLKRPLVSSTTAKQNTSHRCSIFYYPCSYHKTHINSCIA